MTDLPVGFDSRRTVILLALAAGASRIAASGKAGVTDRTLRRWIASEPEFADAIEVASGTGRAIYEEVLREAAAKDWRAAAWMLEALWIGRNKTGPTEEQPGIGGMTIAGSGLVAPIHDPEHSKKVLDLLVSALGQDGLERVLAFRAEWTERDRQGRTE
jgi:hypothetical protein